MFFLGKWNDATKKLPPSPDERTYMLGNAPEYIVMIDGAKLPTSLMFYRGEWVDYNAETYRVRYWAKMPRPRRGVKWARKRNTK